MKLDIPMMVWASDVPAPQDAPVILWNSYTIEGLHSGSISLPRYIEDNAEKVRARLLGFLYEARFVEVHGQTLESALVLPQGLSSWWLTFPSLKQWGQRQSIPLACRFIALEMIVGPAALPSVAFVSDDRSLTRLWDRVVHQKVHISHRLAQRFMVRSIHPLRAIGSALRYWYHSRPLKAGFDSGRPTDNSDIAVFDYLSNDIHNSHTDSYRSPYWGALTDISPSRQWFHVFPRNIEINSVRKTNALVDQLNRESHDRHTLFLGHVGPKDLMAIGRSFLQQVRVHNQYRQPLKNLRSDNSCLELWNVFENEWDDSVTGSTAIRHLILLHTTDRLVRKMPKFKKLYYLMENQPWEVCLTYCVRNRDKGKLIGVAHSTIRFWDLRYFSDPRENSVLDPGLAKPHPDRILVNSRLAEILLYENGFPEHAIGVVEALRYTYLEDLRSIDPSFRSTAVLLGDFLDHANTSLLTMFRAAYSQLESKPALLIRSHPICPLSDEQLGDLKIYLSDQSLPELLKVASLVITTAASSSAAESAALGIPTAVVLDGRTLNYSPFRGSNEVQTIENAHQLAAFLASSARIQMSVPSSIFVLDAGYPRWRREISQN